LLQPENLNPILQGFATEPYWLPWNSEHRPKPSQQNQTLHHKTWPFLLPHSIPIPHLWTHFWHVSQACSLHTNHLQGTMILCCHQFKLVPSNHLLKITKKCEGSLSVTLCHLWTNFWEVSQTCSHLRIRQCYNGYNGYNGYNELFLIVPIVGIVI
jgi:hypothetical protein